MKTRNQTDIGREGLDDQWVKEPAVLSQSPATIWRTETVGTLRHTQIGKKKKKKNVVKM